MHTHLMPPFLKPRSGGLKDLYDAEKQLVKALPKFAKAAADEELAAAFQHHLRQTKGHVQRLEQVFELVGAKAKSKACEGMKGLVEEGSEVLEEDASEALADSAMIGAAKKVEHYEMAAYDSARMLAQAIGNKDAAQLLQETLKEEDETDWKLTQIAKGLVKEGNRGSTSRINGRGNPQPARGQSPASVGAMDANPAEPGKVVSTRPRRPPIMRRSAAGPRSVARNRRASRVLTAATEVAACCGSIFRAIQARKSWSTSPGVNFSGSSMSETWPLCIRSAPRAERRAISTSS